MHFGFLSGTSVHFSLSAKHKLAKEAVLQTHTAVHIAIGHAVNGQPSISSQIAALRRFLLDNSKGERGKWFSKVANVSAIWSRETTVLRHVFLQGVVPLAVVVESADIIASLLVLKAEVEEARKSRIQLTLIGASEAHLLADEM